MNPGAGKVKQINCSGSRNAASRRAPTNSFNCVIASAAPRIDGTNCGTVCDLIIVSDPTVSWPR